MSTGATLVMPMAGRGSRFAREGILEPKPLILLDERPFFWWAVQSVLRQIQAEEMIFIVLQEHIANWKLDRQIHDFYPHAKIVVIADVTSGSAETAALGVQAARGGGPLIINDCDHAFEASGMNQALEEMSRDKAGMLMTFSSVNPNFSYVRMDATGRITGTVEKQVVSPFAIAGCYLFQSATMFTQSFENYREHCPYAELFISGMYNGMVDRGLSVGKLGLDQHLAFGTPEEYRHAISADGLVTGRFKDWT